MRIWLAVLGASAAAYALKLGGHLVPPAWTRHPRFLAATGLLPAAVLAALVVVQTATDGARLVLDARVAGLAAAALALALRAPFLVVVLVSAATAALLRAVTG